MIEENLYQQIREVLPTVCVDLLVTNDKNEYLLAKRKDKPAQGQWWFPGGRIYKGETWKDTALRKGREELGTELRIGNMISVEDYFADDAPWHTVNIVVHAMYDNDSINLDETHEKYRWASKIEDDLHDCLKNPLGVWEFNSLYVDGNDDGC